MSKSDYPDCPPQHLGIDPDARWKECAADHSAFPAKRSIRTAMDAVDDARKNAAAAALLAATGWAWVDDGAGHWEAPPAQAVDLGQFRGWLCTTTDGVATDWTLEDDSRLRFERMGRTIEPIYAASTDKPSTLVDALHGRRNRLMNSYGNGAREDAAIDTQIAEIDAELAKVDSQAVGNK